MKQPNSKYRSTRDLSPVQHEHHEVGKGLPEWFAPGDFTARYRAIHPERAPGSILPSDYCFNRENKGNPTHPRFLLWDGGTKYRFVGMAPADGDENEEAPPQQRAPTSPAASAEPKRPAEHAPPPSVDTERVREALLEFGATITLEEFFPNTNDAAADFSRDDPFAFAMASCLDRGKPSEVIWAIPHDLKQALGHLDPAQLDAMPEAELATVLASLPHRVRYTQAAPRTIKE